MCRAWRPLEFEGLTAAGKTIPNRWFDPGLVGVGVLVLGVLLLIADKRTR